MVTFANTAFNDLYYRTFQQYLRGDVTLDEAKDLLRDTQEETVDDYIDSLEIDITPYITAE